MRLKNINNMGLRCKLYTIKMQLKEARRKKKNVSSVEVQYYKLRREAKQSV